MNEKMQYASMLDIPVNTCNISVKPVGKRAIRRKKPSNHEEVKNELLDKINLENVDVASEEPTTVEKVQEKKRKFSLKLSPLTIELAVIGILSAVIILTNIFNSGSGINVFFKSVFSSDTEIETVDERTFSEFSPVISYGAESLDLVDGVAKISGASSVYAPCDGKISNISLDGNGKYAIEITHSENFKTLLSGIDYAYAEVGDKVFGNIPVGYVRADEPLSMCFLEKDGSVITDYSVEDGKVLWAV